MRWRRIHQEGGETGHFGEFFVLLGGLTAVGGAVLLTLGVTGWLPMSAVLIVGLLFLLEGLGFSFFGAVAMLSGWARRHPDADK